jgi:hypothetical protein
MVKESGPISVENGTCPRAAKIASISPRPLSSFVADDGCSHHYYLFSFSISQPKRTEAHGRRVPSRTLWALAGRRVANRDLAWLACEVPLLFSKLFSTGHNSFSVDAIDHRCLCCSSTRKGDRARDLVLFL